MATTFHPFPRLPSELRAQIWDLAVYPRLVHIRTTEASETRIDPGRCGFASPVPPPALMHACQESRRRAPYQKAFHATLPDESEARYIWVNFQEDLICLADEKVERLAPHEADIRRLRFTVPIDPYFDPFYEYFFHNSHKMMKRFTALRELQVAIKEGFYFWGSVHVADYVKFLDLHTGLLLTGPQLEMAYTWFWSSGGKVQDMDGFDEELQFVVDNIDGLDFNLSQFADVE